MKFLRITALLIASLTAHSCYAQTNPYDLATIPDSIKKNASFITHVNDIVLTIDGIDKSTEDVHKVITVLNEEGRHKLVFRQYTSKSTSLDDVEIKVLDARGKQTAKYRKKDMSSVAYGSGLVPDGFMIYYPIPTNDYPVTVEFNYQVKRKTTLTIPGYYFLGLKEGLIKSDYTVKIVPEINLRYNPTNTAIQPALSNEGKYKVYKWSVNNLAPLFYEENSGPGKQPYVDVVTDQFSHYDVPGDLSSWKVMGSWINQLYDGLDILPAARQQFIRDLVKDATDDKEKVKRIYQYMQHNFRYVSIQLGIGGLKPFSAEFTDQKKYGDCKALSNYMKAALKIVGIKSYVAIINSGYDAEPVDPDFPSSNFDHVILCVPSKTDTTWLECTSSTAAFGELGTFTENRYAFLITENGGVLVPTPKSRSSTSTLNSKTTVKLDKDLSAITSTSFIGTGDYLELLNDILDEKSDDQKQFFVFNMGYRQPDLFELEKGEGGVGYSAKLSMLITKLPEFMTGEKLFISPRINKIWPGKLPKAENRKSDFYFRFPMEKTDTTVFELPEGSKPEQLLSKKELSCEYASYQFNCWYNESENSIYTTTRFVLRQHKIPAANYMNIKKFFDGINQEDTQKIVLKKGPEADKKAF